jgi:hypothetical protein
MTTIPQISRITIGADPECFIVVRDNHNGDTPYPIVGMLGGTKDNPLVIADGYAVVEDNVMAEFNIPPTNSVEEFIKSNKFMLSIIIQMVRGYNPLFELDFSPALRFEEHFLQSEQAKEFGCLPDFSAYTNLKKQPSAEEAGTLRTAGGHIHIGWEGPKDFKVQQAVCRAFDLMVVLPFMLIEPDNERRELYGAPGSMRPKSYGVECRSLSCFWLSSDYLMGWVFEKTLKAVEAYNTIPELSDPKSKLCMKVRELIKRKDVDKIKDFISKFELATT